MSASKLSKKNFLVQPRIIWSFQETEDLIEIVQSKFINKIMSSKNGRKWPIFEQVTEEMEKYGHDKTTQQIIFKYKNLCAMYRSGKQMGKPPKMDKRYEFFDRMHQLFEHANNSANDASETDGQDNGNTLATYIDEEFEASGNDTKDDSVRNVTTTRKRFLKRASLANDGEGDDYDNDNDPLRSEAWSQELSPSASKHSRTAKNEPVIGGEADIELLTDKMIDDPKMSSYTRCINYLVKNFHTAQEDLQNKFYQQQLKLQQQQQEWEERMLDEEREFFSKILKFQNRSKDDYNF